MRTSGAPRSQLIVLRSRCRIRSAVRWRGPAARSSPASGHCAECQAAAVWISALHDAVLFAATVQLEPPETGGDRDMEGSLGRERHSGWDLLSDATNSAAAKGLHVGGRSYDLAAGEELLEYAIRLVVVRDPQLGRNYPAVHRLEIGLGSRVSLSVD